MKNRVLIAIIILFILQIVLLVFIFRPAGTPIDTQRTPIPTLPRATLPVVSSNPPQVGAGECTQVLTQISCAVEDAKLENETTRIEIVWGMQPLIKSSDIWLIATNRMQHGKNLAAHLVSNRK
jgi:hypothetical protein